MHRSPRRRRNPRGSPRPSLLLAAVLPLVASCTLGGTSIELGVGYRFVDAGSTLRARHDDALYTSEADDETAVWIAIHQQLTPQRVVVERTRPYVPVLMPEEPAPSDIDAKLEAAFPLEDALDRGLDLLQELDEIPEHEHEDEPTLVIPFIGEIMVRIPQGDWKMAMALAMIVAAGGFFVWVLMRGRKKNQT